MAVPVSNSKQVFGILLWDAVPNPTKLYIYARGASRAEMRHLLGYVKRDGTIVYGPFTDFFRTGTFAAANDSIDLASTTHVNELDTDADSPHEGEVRFSIALAATA
jgi:hypothetical protein